MSDYARREAERRFVVYLGSKVHCETVDRDQAEHVKRLLECDGHKDVAVRVLTANQEAANA